MPKPRALDLLRQRQSAAKNPSKRELAAWNNFYASASPKQVVIPEIPKQRAKATPWEHIEQVKVIKWWRDHCADYGLPEFALFAIPNAGKRSLHVGESMRAEGLRKGAPDLMLAARSKYQSGHFALFMEMKPLKGGTWEPEQQEFCRHLESHGYLYYVCKGAPMAIEMIVKYLS